VAQEERARHERARRRDIVRLAHLVGRVGVGVRVGVGLVLVLGLGLGVRVCLAYVVESVVAFVGTAAQQLAVLEEPRAGAAAPKDRACFLQRVLVPDQLGAHLVRLRVRLRLWGRVRVRVRVRVWVWVWV